MKTAIWIVCATLALTWVLGGNHALVPWPPESIALWLVDLVGAQNADEIGQVEVLYMMAVSFIVVVGGTVLARRIWKH